MNNKVTFFLLPLLLLFYGCGGGISPEPENPPLQTGFGGTVIFKGTWPENVRRTHIVAFKNPLNSPSDFNALNLAFVSDSIPYGVTNIVYSSLINPLLEIKPGKYSYVAVAQSGTQTISLDRKDWTVVGIFYAVNDTTKPGELVIPEGKFIGDVDIICDYNNPPPQPPGG
ncbi:MAG: hypothetical protein ACM3S2_05215 [Ignavibacteriales bacterium]